MIKIREAESRDAIKFLETINAVGAESEYLDYGSEGVNTTAVKQTEYLDYMNKSDKDAILIAVNENEDILGFTILKNNGDSKTLHRVTLGIAVRKEYWNQGIGKMLLESAIEYAKNIKLEVISLDVRCDNVNAIHLYQEYGFKTIGTFEKFFKYDDKYYDAYLMNLYL